MIGRKAWMMFGAVLALCSSSFIFRYVAFSQTSFVNGWDGYFYINQVRSFMDEGKMDVPDFSLIYPLMMLIQLVVKNYVLSYKILAAILAGTFTLSLFLLALKWTENLGVALVLGCLSLFSPHLTYFAAQYPKNLLGVIFFIWLLYSIDSKNKVVPIFLLALNFFGHRVTVVLSFVFLIANTVLKRITGFMPYVLILFAVLFVAGGFFLPGLLNLFDAERFQGMISARPQFAPYSFVSTFGPELMSNWWLTEIIGCCMLLLLAAAYAVRNHDIRLTILVIILCILIFPFFTWSIDGPAFRLFLIFILLCPLLLIFLLNKVEVKFAREIVCLLLFACSFFSYSSYNPAKHDPPYKLYSVVGMGILSNIQADSVELIIAHKALAEYIVYATNIDAMSWLPEYEIDKARLWRIAEGAKDIQFGYYLDSADLAFVYRLTPSYTLVREDRWRKFLQRVKDDGNDELLMELTNWKNPNRVRPYFMLRRR